MLHAFNMSALTWLLAWVLLWSAALNLYGPSFVREEFAAWGYPMWMRWAVGATEIVSAALMLGSAPQLGAALAACVLLGVLISLARAKLWLRMEYPVVLLALVVLILISPQRGSLT